MPMPTPADDEDRAAFMERCMSDDTMLDEFPDPDQRAAVCQRQWAGEDKAFDQLDLEVKLGEPGEDGTFEGVASVFNEADLIGDIIAPGAFKKSLSAHRWAGRMPLLLWIA